MSPIKLLLIIIITIFCSGRKISSKNTTSTDVRNQFHQMNLQQIENLYQEFDYCNHKCKKSKHTACVPGGGRCVITCKYEAEYLPMTSVQRDAIVNLHNRLRNKVANGEESRVQLGGIKVADMRPLKWSTEAEYIAECHVKQCSFKHDSCRKYRNNMLCGQNIALKIQTHETKNDYKKHDFWTDSISAWYEEIENCGCNFSQPFRGKSVNVLAFTQFIWAKSQYIGCAYLRYTKNSQNHIQLTCNYCPAGNKIGESVFTIGNIQDDWNVDPVYQHLYNPNDLEEIEPRMNKKVVMEKSDYDEDGSGDGEGKSGTGISFMKIQKIKVVFLFCYGLLLNCL